MKKIYVIRTQRTTVGLYDARPFWRMVKEWKVRNQHSCIELYGGSCHSPRTHPHTAIPFRQENNRIENGRGKWIRKKKKKNAAIVVRCLSDLHKNQNVVFWILGMRSIFEILFQRKEFGKLIAIIIFRDVCHLRAVQPMAYCRRRKNLFTCLRVRVCASVSE